MPLLYYLCTPSYCINFSNLLSLDFLPVITADIHANRLFSTEAFAVAVFWMLFQVGLERLLPAKEFKGIKLRNNTQLTYRVNGHLAFWISIACAAASCAIPGSVFGLPNRFVLSWIYDNYLQLAVSFIIISGLLSVYLYASSFKKGALLAEGGNSGNPIYDFYIGRELNPRIGATFDLKYFCELRPGLIGWIIINIGMLLKQMEGSESGLPSLSMLCVNIFQALYVWDGLNSESAILTTMDITTDGFGFMLAFGDLVWVPFTYTLQARYLVLNDPALPVWLVGAFAALNLLGYSIFRGANGEKDRFRTNPDSCQHLKWMPTERGTKLIISGWWGLARKINYTGDWLMALSWCLVCGFASFLPYFYATYFAILLIHRAFRDDHACRLKYGADWDKYKQHVPYLFVPKII